MTPQTIAISQIDASDRLRPVDPLVVTAYAGLAEDRVNAGLAPLIQPIVARPVMIGGDVDAYKLTVGAHRLAALIEIGRTELTVGVDVIVSVEDDDASRDSEIFENLANPGLIALDRAIFLAEAKSRFDAKRGETRGRKRKDQQFKEDKKIPQKGIIFSERFTTDAAKRIGLAESKVSEAVRIAKAIDAGAVAGLRGTMIADNQNELKQFAQLRGDQQLAAVSAIRDGRAKNVAQARVAIGLDKPKTGDPQGRIYVALRENWDKASRQTRAQFMADYGLVFAGKDLGGEK